MDITALKNLIQINGGVTSQIIKDLIADHREKAYKMKALYDRYCVETSGVPIFSRTFEDNDKINNKINNDFFGEIIDIKVGYFAGTPITYDLDKNMYTEKNVFDEARHKRDFGVISNFNIRNNIDDTDAETAKRAAICGYGARLLYIDRQGKEKVMNLYPWEAIFVSDGSVNEPQYAMRYYQVYVSEGKDIISRIRVEWYDQYNISFYIENKSGNFVPDTTEPVNPKPHLFNGIPLICFPNNDELQGDAEKVLSLIDNYDRTFSDVSSELEQFRLAYMAFYGAEPDEETMAKAKRTGAFGLDAGEGVKVEFITKSLNDTIVEHHLDRTEDNILRFAKSVNFNDESFGGNITGIAMKFKLFGLESKCITAERKFIAALRQQYEILCTAWKKKGIDIDYTNIFYDFKRNFPLNILDEAETTTKLKGMVSERTRLSQLSFVDDVDYELKRMQQEASELVDLDDPGLNEGE
jgi:SPP1 family phage portal protein